MDYQLGIFPSSEKDLQNVKTLNSTKVIKAIQEQKLPIMYKKSFGAAVKQHDERAISGKLIEDYYKSILASNIPEVYKLSLIVRYEVYDKNEAAIVQKIFLDFKKAFEQSGGLTVVSAYMMTFDEFKELQLYFYPVVDGYMTGLSARNDLIDFIKKKKDIKDNLNIVRAMPLFTDYVLEIFNEINQGQLLSQEELEAKARNYKEESPFETHAIAVETLKMQMNMLQQKNAENQQLEKAVNAEVERIKHDLVWVKETEQRIQRAELDRIELERIRKEEEKKREAERRAMEAQRREEDRLREEARRIEAQKLAEQARRNIEMRKAMAAEAEAERQKKAMRNKITMEQFENLVEQHIRWQDTYNINEETNIDSLPSHVLKDPRRLILNMADISDVSFERTIFLFGTKFIGCEFMNCRFTAELNSCIIEHCTFISSDLFDLELMKCSVNGLNIERLVIDNININDSEIIQSNFKYASIQGLTSAPGTTFIRCNFTEAELRQCDMKKNAFVSCNFDKTFFAACDMRDSAFQVCKLDTIKKEGSLFKGAKVSQRA